MLYQIPIVDFEDPTVYVRTKLYRKTSQKRLRQWLSLLYFESIFTFSETGHGNKQKKIMMSGKVTTSTNKMVYVEGYFFLKI